MNVAVLLPGLLGAYQFSIESIMENVVVPHRADVFVLTSRKNYLHLMGDDREDTLFTEVTATDEKRIADVFGDRLKLFAYSEDTPDYEERMEREVAAFEERIQWIASSEKDTVMFFDKASRRASDPRRYLDQYLRLSYLCDWAKGYDAVIRMRIDQILEQRLPLDDTKHLRYFQDNLFLGSAQSVGFVGRNLVNMIGGYSEIEHIPDAHNYPHDYRLGQEEQFLRFLAAAPFESSPLPLSCGFRLFLRSGSDSKEATVLNFSWREKVRRVRGVPLSGFYGFSPSVQSIPDGVKDEQAVMVYCMGAFA